MLHHLLTLARVSNLPTVWSNCLAAWLIAGAVPSWNFVPLLLGASLLYAGGCTLNDAFDADWDARHRPERLIPSGVLRRGTVWLIGLAEIAAGLLAILAGGVTNVWPPLALAGCIILYDAWHKPCPSSVVVMGACRWLLYLTAAVAAGSADLNSVMLCGAVIWLYIIVLSLVARGEANRGESVPRTRHLLLIVPLAVMAAAWLEGSHGREVWAPAIVAFAGIELILPKSDAPVAVWVNRLLAGIPIIDLCVVFTVWNSLDPSLRFWTLAFPVAVALCFLFQRWFRAT
jgi:4-hydroxybenzoate polyprenyltransferase